MGSYTSFPIPNVAFNAASPPLTAKFAQTFGDGSSTSYTFTHNLGTKDVHVAVYVVSSGIVAQLFTATIVDINNVTVALQSAPALNTLRVVIIG